MAIVQDTSRAALRAVFDSVFADPRYAWREHRDPLALLRRWWSALLGWLDGLRAENPIAFRVLFWGLVALFGLLLIHAAWIVVRTVGAGSVRAGGAETAAGAPRRDAAWYRSEADRLGAEGRLVEAMQADLLGLLLELDARRILRYHPSKTLREHVTEAKVGDDTRAELTALVWTFYRHAFAREPVTPEQAADWRSRTRADRYAPAH